MIATQPSVAAPTPLKLPPELTAAAKLIKREPLFIDVGALFPGGNPRDDFDADELKALAVSMTSLTLLAPVTRVRPVRRDRIEFCYSSLR